MKKRKHLLLILAMISLSVLLVGCGSPEKTIEKIQSISLEERTEKDWVNLAKAYWELGSADSARSTLNQAKGYIYDYDKLDELLKEYVLPAPTADKAPGSFEGQLRLNFRGDLYSYGKLYVTVDRDEPLEELEINEGVADDGINIFEYPSEHEFYIYLYQPGEHTVRAFVVAESDSGPELQSEIFEGKYTITGADYSNIAFSAKPGDHKAPLSLSVNGASGTNVYYTINGDDPLFVSAGGANLDYKGKELTQESLKLPIGKSIVKARAITTDGLISPLLSGEYNVTITFDSASDYVSEDGYYEYIGNSAGLRAYDLTNDSGKESAWHNVWERKISHMAVFTNKPENGNNIKTVIYARLVTGDVYVAEIKDGKAESWRRVSSWDSLKNVGNWLIYPSEATSHWDYYSTATSKYYVRNAKWNGAGDPIGTEGIAKIAALMTDQMAVRVGTIEGGQRGVIATNPDGSNMRVLWNPEPQDYVVLDAMTDKLIFYQVKGKHMVYNIEKNTHFENTQIPAGSSVIGYTSNAVYINQGGITRIPMDYEALAKK